MKLKLEVFPGDFGLPSMDFDCLRTILFCKITKIDVDIVYRTNLLFHKVPCLKDASSGEKLGDNFPSIINYFRKNNSSIASSSQTSGNGFNNIADMFITGADQFCISMQQDLKPAFLQIWWRDEENYNEFLRSWFAERFPFPINFFWPRYFREKAITEFVSLVSIQIDNNNSDKVEKRVLNRASGYIRTLSKYLILTKPSSYLLGDKPSIADVTLLTYLLMFHRSPCKNQQIKQVITQNEAVLKYVEKAAERYLGDAPGLNSKDPYACRFEESKLKTNDLILSGAFAVTAMILFAVTHGIIYNNSSRYDDVDDVED